MKVSVRRARVVSLRTQVQRLRGRERRGDQPGQPGQSYPDNEGSSALEEDGQPDYYPVGGQPDHYLEGGQPERYPEGDHPENLEGRPQSESAVTNGHGHTRAAPRATVVPSALELDYRLRGLRSEPSDDSESTDVPAPARREDHRQQNHLAPLLMKVTVLAALAALAVLLLRAFVVQPFAVPGNAMTPTLQEGDRILVLKSGLLDGSIHSGEIVVFHPRQSLPCAVAGGHNGDLVLRVVALPGEVIRSVGETIFLNGRPLRERGWYDRRFGQVGSIPIRSTTVAPGQYFVMADNRSDACDSRVFGPISKSSVVGEGIAVVGHHGHVSFGTL